MRRKKRTAKRLREQANNRRIKEDMKRKKANRVIKLNAGHKGVRKREPELTFEDACRMDPIFALQEGAYEYLDVHFNDGYVYGGLFDENGQA